MEHDENREPGPQPSIEHQPDDRWYDVIEPSTPIEPDYAVAPTAIRPSRQPLRGRAAIAAAAVGSILLGGVAAAGALAGPTNVAAQTGSATTGTSDPSAAPGTTTAPDASNAPNRMPGQDWDHHNGGPGGFGGLGPNHEAVSDTSVAANAIGISESDLITALQGGQTMAQVAKAHNVDPQKVIDALVTDGLNELATAVKNGQLTQAQADSMKTDVTQRATDQVNGTFGAWHH